MAFTAQQLAERMPDARELLSDEPEMESTQHYQQLALLVSHGWLIPANNHRSFVPS